MSWYLLQQVHRDTWACSQLQFPSSIPLFEARIPLVWSQHNLQAGTLGRSQGRTLWMHPFPINGVLLKLVFINEASLPQDLDHSIWFAFPALYHFWYFVGDWYTFVLASLWSWAMFPVAVIPLSCSFLIRSVFAIFFIFVLPSPCPSLFALSLHCSSRRDHGQLIQNALPVCLLVSVFIYICQGNHSPLWSLLDASLLVFHQMYYLWFNPSSHCLPCPQEWWNKKRKLNCGYSTCKTCSSPPIVRPCAHSTNSLHMISHIQIP